MKKIIKISALLLFISALANTPVNASERAISTNCPKCHSGVVSKRTQSLYQHDERFACQHGKKI